MKIPKYGANDGDYVGVADDEKIKIQEEEDTEPDRLFRGALGFGYRKNDVPRIGRFVRTQIEKYKYWV